jgi:hypothetical protein
MGGSVSSNLSSMGDMTGRIVAHIITTAREEALVADRAIVEANRSAELAWTDEVKRRALWFSVMPTCTPSYFNGEGKGAFEEKSPEQIKAELKRTPWGTGPLDYKARMQGWMQFGSLDGFGIRN